MFGRTRRFWVGVVLLVVGAVLLFAHYVPGLNKAPLILLALGVLTLAAGTLLIAVPKGRRPV